MWGAREILPFAQYHTPEHTGIVSREIHQLNPPIKGGAVGGVLVGRRETRGFGKTRLVKFRELVFGVGGGSGGRV